MHDGSTGMIGDMRGRRAVFAPNASPLPARLALPAVTSEPQAQAVKDAKAALGCSNAGARAAQTGGLGGARRVYCSDVCAYAVRALRTLACAPGPDCAFHPVLSLRLPCLPRRAQHTTPLTRACRACAA